MASGKRLWSTLGAILLCSAVLADAARAISVTDFNVAEIGNDVVLVSGDGRLEFSQFNFYLGGADFDDFTLSVLDDGVRLSGPMSASNGQVREYYFTYQVTALGDDALIDGVTLFAPSTIAGSGFPTFAKTGKTVYAGGAPEAFDADWDWLAALKVINFDGSYSELASQGFAPQRTLSVLDGTMLSAAGQGDSASVASISNTFSVVPEPATLMMLGIGVLGLSFAGRRS